MLVLLYISTPVVVIIFRERLNASYMSCPIHPVSEDLNEGRDVVDDAFTDTLFQSRINDGKNEFRCVSVRKFGVLLDVL